MRLTEKYGLAPSEIGSMPLSLLMAYIEGPSVVTFKTEKDFQRYMAGQR